MASAFAIDGDATTRWGGAFTSEQWLQVDLGTAASVGGMLLHWGSDFAASYRILASTDGRAWQPVFETTDGQGDIDYVFFPVVQARYLRLASQPLSADWGVSLFELEPLSAADSPRVEGLIAGSDPAVVWAGVTPPRSLLPAHTVTIALPRPLPTTGIEVYWGAGKREARLEGREADGAFRTLALDSTQTSDHS